eukprot:GHVT01023593.1.p1 GENE.GHVT01023593.1~~GHVT01023593.1.p1  ORF type:complete len:445 (-),score=76.05 GHVT01023593.1:58-1392(-)
MNYHGGIPLLEEAAEEKACTDEVLSPRRDDSSTTSPSFAAEPSSFCGSNVATPSGSFSLSCRRCGSSSCLCSLGVCGNQCCHSSSPKAFAAWLKDEVYDITRDILDPEFPTSTLGDLKVIVPQSVEVRPLGRCRVATQCANTEAEAISSTADDESEIQKEKRQDVHTPETLEMKKEQNMPNDTSSSLSPPSPAAVSSRASSTSTSSCLSPSISWECACCSSLAGQSEYGGASLDTALPCQWLILVRFIPTVAHCHLASLIGLSIRFKVIEELKSGGISLMMAKRAMEHSNGGSAPTTSAFQCNASTQREACPFPCCCCCGCSASSSAGCSSEATRPAPSSSCSSAALPPFPPVCGCTLCRGGLSSMYACSCSHDVIFLPFHGVAKVRVLLGPQSHVDSASLDKQINDKERACAALENGNIKSLVLKAVNDDQGDESLASPNGYE